MRIAGVVLVIALAGCAALKNTPQQDYVWELGRVCDRQVSFWKMDTVRADGSYIVRGATNAPPGWQDYQACMADQMKAKPYRQWLQERPADK